METCRCCGRADGIVLTVVKLRLTVRSLGKPPSRRTHPLSAEVYLRQMSYYESVVCPQCLAMLDGQPDFVDIGGALWKMLTKPILLSAHKQSPH